MSTRAPVALILFNRPEATACAFAVIREARPRHLLLIADGPRSREEATLTDAARRVVDQIDWDCRIDRDYADVNLGCRQRVATGIDWVFENCDEAIILEDDCVPEPAFFRYCDELLERYREENRVSMVSGDNFHAGIRRGDASYYFSAIAHVWGWATWRRAWKSFDVNMRSWPEDRESPWLRELLLDDAVRATYRRAFDAAYEGKVDTWDAQWQLAVWRSRGLVALPNVNLVTNVGFGGGATHTRRENSPDANLPTQPIAFPLIHPREIARDAVADLFTWRRSMATRTIA